MVTKDGASASVNYVTFSIINPSFSLYANYIGITKAPTANCQLSSIACMNNLLSQFGYRHLSPVDNCDRTGILKTIFRCYELINMQAQLVMADVHQHYVLGVEHCFKHIHAKTPYTSTNGSSMCQFLLNMREEAMYMKDRK